MNPVTKNITVNFFELKSDDGVAKKFKSSFISLVKLGGGTDVVANAHGRFVINCLKASDKSVNGRNLLYWSTVKERNTWQVRSTQSGKISGLDDSNSIVGDITYFKFDPESKIIAAFTTYSSSTYLKAMCKSIFKRLVSESIDISIEYLSDDVGITEVRNWDYYSKISINLNTDKISSDDEKPELIKALLGIKDSFGGSEINVTLNGGQDKLPKQDVADTINYLSSSEGCSSLSVDGGKYDDDTETSLSINLKKAFIKYATSVELKPDHRYIDEQQGDTVLTAAFVNTRLS